MVFPITKENGTKQSGHCQCVYQQSLVYNSSRVVMSTQEHKCGDEYNRVSNYNIHTLAKSGFFSSLLAWLSPLASH